jgi:hypothetical protein
MHDVEFGEHLRVARCYSVSPEKIVTQNRKTFRASRKVDADRHLAPGDDRDRDRRVQGSA